MPTSCAGIFWALAMRKYKTRADLLKKAIDALDAGYSLREISRVTGIPVSTLQCARAGSLRYLFDVENRNNARSICDSLGTSEDSGALGGKP